MKNKENGIANGFNKLFKENEKRAQLLNKIHNKLVEKDTEELQTILQKLEGEKK